MPRSGLDQQDSTLLSLLELDKIWHWAKMNLLECHYHVLSFVVHWGTFLLTSGYWGYYKVA